ncbi:hypothetical protein [Bacillus mycoides]|uniref:hypothetical protein n=1 Tax=Bacillus mycoides TaxID=1405 RepID=UPI003A8088A9
MLSIQLQGIGETSAVRAKELKVGDVTVWNYGYLETVKSITPSKTGKTLKIEIEYESISGVLAQSERTLRVDRLVGISK